MVGRLVQAVITGYRGVFHFLPLPACRSGYAAMSGYKYACLHVLSVCCMHAWRCMHTHNNTHDRPTHVLVCRSTSPFSSRCTFCPGFSPLPWGCVENMVGKCPIVHKIARLLHVLWGGRYAKEPMLSQCGKETPVGYRKGRLKIPSSWFSFLEFGGFPGFIDR